MRNIAPVYQGNVVQFPQRHKGINCLTKRDKLDVANFRQQAETAGFDALMIHILMAGESHGTTDYVSAYRAGQVWSTWCFARDGETVRSWNALTSKDSGVFPTMSEALGSILSGQARHGERPHAEKC